MPTKPHITLMGAGNLAHVLGPALNRAGYRIEWVVSRPLPKSQRRATALAKKLVSGVQTLDKFKPTSEIAWLCITDDALAGTAEMLARKKGWKKKIVLHSSGALTSDVLAPLRRAGAYTASLHPMMTFVPGTAPVMKRVSFAVEGHKKAIVAATRIVRALGAHVFPLRKESKVLYHAFGSFSSPMIVATLVTAERVGQAAGLSRNQMAKMIGPILEQTIHNYRERGAAGAFSGPVPRGDLNTVRRHLQELQRVPEAKEVYRALVQSALLDLPSKNAKGLLKLMRSNRRQRPTGTE